MFSAYEPRQIAEASAPDEAPTAWKQRAVDRSLRTAKARAEQRLQRFLDAAQAIIAEKGTTDLTVQEVVDRSKQSLRSFYSQFDGKRELLLALLEDTLGHCADQIRAAAAGQSDPIEGLHVAVVLLFELTRPDPHALRPLFTDFAPQLLASHPTEVRIAHAPLFALYTDLMETAEAEGKLRKGIDAGLTAEMTMQTVMHLAQSSGAPNSAAAHSMTAEKVWEFCSHGFAKP